MRLLICGGRDFLDVEYAIPRIHRVHVETPVTTLICGTAKGGDSIGFAWAKELDIPVDAYPITKEDWQKHGKAAGPLRNEDMLAKGCPDQVIGLPGGNGTAHMCRISRESGIPATAYRYNYFEKEDPVYGCFSNFYPSPFADEDGVIYPTNEHYYQAAKTLDQTRRNKIIEAPNAAAAKKLGNAKTLPLRPDWDSYKIAAMMDGLRLKFPDQHDLTDRLLFSGDDYLVEYAPWGDTFWGVGKDKKGQNWLGRLLMRRRDEIMSGRLYR